MEHLQSLYSKLQNEFQDYKETSIALEDELETRNSELISENFLLRRTLEEVRKELATQHLKFRSEVLDADQERSSLREKLSLLRKALAQKDERVVLLEVETSELESQIRVQQASFSDLKDKLDELVEELAIEKTDYEELQSQEIKQFKLL